MSKLTRALVKPSCAWLCLILITPPAAAAEKIGPAAEYAAAAAALESAIAREMRDHELPAVSIALVDGDRIVWAQGFGSADPAGQRPATAETVYRVGSVSKLFTDLGIMQLVERGEVDLDQPVAAYLPDFKPRNPFPKAITLRQLMSHRSGLVREPPAGNYFDPTGPTLAQTVASLNATALVYEPEARIKYSNAGIAVAGRVLERLKGKPFAECLEQAVLEPLGLVKSGFALTPAIGRDLARASMWTYGGRRFEAPTFQLGMAPAGSMYSTVIDLGRFLTALFNGGSGPKGRLVKPETLEKMWEPQFAAAGEKSGFGIGFAISQLEGRRRIGHGGAIYGFATELEALPDAKLGVVAATSLDVANAVMERIAGHALKLMLARREGKPLPAYPMPEAVGEDLARRLEGRYARGGEMVEIFRRPGGLSRGEVKLFLRRRELTLQLKKLESELIAADPLGYGLKVAFGEGEVNVGGEVFQRIPDDRPAAPPERWRGLIGEYGWDHNTLYILERDGRLHALIEWFFCYPLTEVAEDAFAFPDYGLYHGEKLIFQREASGRASQVEAASVVFKRRPLPSEGGPAFRIRPLRPVEELRRKALAARPPEEKGGLLEPDLVELKDLDPSLRFDIRYAAADNFMGAAMYEEPRAFLQRPAAEALLRAHRALGEKGYGLLIHDGYRPWFVTRIFWEATPPEQRHFVADPSKGSRHNRGCAVDLTLYDLKTGEPAEMVSGYDEFSARAYPDYPGGASLQRWHRELLRRAMEAEGFQVYEYEWWHFDYQDWRRYPILNLRFDQVSKN
ncbi:MAG: serine hydrolase [Planctomycetes bacterium]|nr:serine hydrolase [Planctomycetota bacterium]